MPRGDRDRQHPTQRCDSNDTENAMILRGKQRHCFRGLRPYYGHRTHLPGGHSTGDTPQGG